MKKIIIKILIVSIFILLSFNLLGEVYFSNTYEESKWQNLLLQKNSLKTFQQKKEWLDEIILLFSESDRIDDLVLYLGEISTIEKDEIFLDLLYFNLHNLYWNMGLKDIAIFYALKINEQNYSINYKSSNIGYYIAKRIITTDAPFKIKEKMYKLLFNKYYDKIDVPFMLYEFSNLYRKNFDIDSAVSLLTKFIRTSPHYNNEEANIDLRKIRKEINFYNSNKRWIYQDLNKLIKNIKSAIIKRNKKRLDRYVSQIGFFGKVSQKINKRGWTYQEIKIDRRWPNKIIFAKSLEEYSGDQEAYLKTSNWNTIGMHIWYFYFKRVDYPYNPNIDGGWEWKGIYFGQRY